MKARITNLLKHNIVIVLFVVLCTIGFIFSKQTFTYLFSEVLSRLFRNLPVVMSLVIPVVAGIGLNFGIVLGAMSAQAAIILVTHWQLTGVPAVATMYLLSTPLALFLGFLLGQLFNRTKGQEMITGMIVGFFANGVYQLIFLVIIGTLIPMVDERIMVYTGVGIKDTLKLDDAVTGTLDNILKVPMSQLYLFIFAGAFVWLVFNIYKALKKNDEDTKSNVITYAVGILFLSVLLIGFMTVKDMKNALKLAKVPVVPLIIIILIGLLVNAILRSKLGQDFRAVGFNRTVAASAGIDVNRTRIIAIMLSTMIAAWGQIIFIVNIGNFATYSAHEKVSLYAIASILVGGASVEKASIKHCVIGIILFHTLFVVAPLAGKNLLGDPSYGEYFREAVSYGVIALSLILHFSDRPGNAKKDKEKK